MCFICNLVSQRSLVCSLDIGGNGGPESCIMTIIMLSICQSTEFLFSVVPSPITLYTVPHPQASLRCPHPCISFLSSFHSADRQAITWCCFDLERRYRTSILSMKGDQIGFTGSSLSMWRICGVNIKGIDVRNLPEIIIDLGLLLVLRFVKIENRDQAVDRSRVQSLKVWLDYVGVRRKTFVLDDCKV